MQNNVFPFFLASHMSIWVQPNHCRVNKWFHCALEQSACQMCHWMYSATLPYFNCTFAHGWQLFLNGENKDRLSSMTRSNNTTNTYWCTGLHPLDPFCSAWRESIDSLGINASESTAIQYEVQAKPNPPKLTNDEKLLLCESLSMDPWNDLGDQEVAIARGDQILQNGEREFNIALAQETTTKRM